MTAPVPMRDRVRDACSVCSTQAPSAVTTKMYDALRVMVTPHGWTLMLSEDAEAGRHRAWMRHTSGRRMFGRPQPTAEAAAMDLLAKVAPLARGRA